MEFKKIGVITDLFGTNGAFLLGNVPKTLPKILKGTSVKIGFSYNFSIEYKIKSWKKYKKYHKSQVSNSKFCMVVAGFEGISDIEIARTLIEKAVFIEEETLNSQQSQISNLKSNLLIDDELIGLNVLEQGTGKKLGKIVDIWLMPANEVWVVETPKGNITVPAIDDVIKNINIKKKFVEIVLIPGLLDLTEN